MKNGNMLYVHPALVRVWHWINAVGFVILILTGFQIRYADQLGFMPLKDAISLHNFVGFTVIINYLLWLIYYLGGQRIKIYIPDFRTLAGKAVQQMKYYGYGIFKGDPNPHVMTADDKFNALQQQSYLVLMFILLPAQMISGVFLWKMKGYSEYITLLGGIKVIDTIHVILFFIFTAFILVHCYLATLGHNPLAHFKAMFTGFEEHAELSRTTTNYGNKIN